MKRASLLIACLAMSTVGHACAFSYARLAMTLASERAIIIWDQELKEQHFIRSTVFNGDAEDFGFILPTPYQPREIEVADQGIFGILEAHDPELVAKRARGGATKGRPVRILEQKRVGDYEVTVLQADEGWAIRDWLKKNGHSMRPALKPWLDYYAHKGWVLNAFKYVGTQVRGKATEAVRVTFKADEPHYPYKMPTDTWENPSHHRKLDLFVISQTRMKGAYVSGGDWETPALWDAGLKDASTTLLEKGLSTPGAPMTLRKGMVVTRFSNVPQALGYDSDLVFRPDSHEVPVFRFFALTLGATFLLLVLIKRRAGKAPAGTGRDDPVLHS